ncbi:MAG: hypothetical protein AABY22_28195 [Nanoarchaeota archaeon]
MDKIRAQLIMEVLGTPKDYVQEVLENLRKEIEKENGVNLISFNIGEAKEIQDSKDFFTGFLDVEIETEKLEFLLGMCFKYMPAHIDLIYPEKIHFTNSQIAELLNYLVTRLHGYDEVARILQLENEKLGKEIGNLREEKKL